MRYDLVNSTRQVDLGSLTWTPYRNTGYYNVFSAPLAHDKTKWVTLPGYSKTDYVLYGRDKTFGWNSNDFIYVCNSEADHMTGAQFKTFIAGTIITFVNTDVPIRFDMMQPQTNLFDSSSSWNINASIGTGEGNHTFPYSTAGNRHTFVFLCKPSTKYKWKCSSVGDRLLIVGNDTVIDPLSYTLENKYLLTDSNIFYSNTSTGELEVEFTTKSTTKMVFVYYSLETLPTGISIYEANPKRYTFVNDTKQVDMGTLTFTKRADGTGQNRQMYATLIPDMVPEVSVSTVVPAWCEGYHRVTRNTTVKHLDMSYATQGPEPYRYIVFVNNDYQTPEAFKAAMSGRILTYQSTLKETL